MTKTTRLGTGDRQKYDPAYPHDQLEHWPGNARRGVVAGIKESIQVNGFTGALIVQKSTNRVIAGNHRLMAWRELREEDPGRWGDTVPVILWDVNDSQANRYNLADNKTADDASWDDRALLDQLEAIQAEDGLLGTGFSDDELDDLRAVVESMGDLDGLEGGEIDTEAADDTDVEPPEEAITRVGDVWEFGEHRVLCGSATDLPAVQKFLGDDVPDCLWTDPPYGIEYVGKTKQALTIQNDGPAGLPALLDGAFETAADVLRPGAPTYIACPPGPLQEVFWREAGKHVDLRQGLVWVKNTMVLGRSDYHYSHESILYGFTPAQSGSGRMGRGGDKWYGDNSQTTVFYAEKPGRNADHPTMKPVRLIIDTLVNSCPPDGMVLDLFAGSGSTALAAEQMGWKARLVELDPRYVDVIVRRYQELTGDLPVRDGQPVDFLAEGSEPSRQQ